MRIPQIENEISKIHAILETEDDVFQRNVLNLRLRGLLSMLDRAEAARESYETRTMRARSRRLNRFAA